MVKENGLNMVDMHNIDPKTILKFNLEKEEMKVHGDTFEEYEYVWKIDDSEWWVMGINTKTNTVYAQIDSIYPTAIRDLTNNNYVLIGIVDEFQPGMISTRDWFNPIKDIKDFIKEECVYELRLME